MPKKLLYIGLLFGLLLGSPLFVCAQDELTVVANGFCGDGDNYENVTWTLYSNDSLAVVGTGAMGSNADGEGYNNFQSDLRGKVRTVYFSDGLTYIGRYALSYLPNLASITVDPANEDYDSRDNCNCLIETKTKTLLFTSLNCFIPDGVEIIRDYAISDAYGIESIRIPRSVKQMGETTPPTNRSTPFVSLTLKDITVEWENEDELPEWMMTNPSIMYYYNITLHVPCGTESIYANAEPWKTCKDIVEEGCCEIDGECGYDETDNVYWSYANCDSLLTISGEGRMKSYENSTNRPWKDYTNKIKHIVIEEGITEIGLNAFTGFSFVDSVDIPKSVKTIGAYAFRNCSKLKDIYVHWDGLMIPAWDQMTNKSPQSSITLHVPCGYDHLYQERDGWKDYTPVADMPSIKEGTWETNIFWSVDHCDSTLTIAGSGEFRCEGKWDLYGEFNHYYVKRAVISKDITYLGIFTLSGCPNMEYIDVEAGNPTHRSGYNAIIRNGNGTEGDTLMFGCKNTVIPPTVTAIRGYAFWDSHKVTEMRIPTSVNEIGNSNYPKTNLWLLGQGKVFYTSDEEGEGLKDLYVEWTAKEDIPVLKAKTLGDMDKVRLHVPCGMAEVYKEVEGWTQFKEYIEEESTVSVDVNDPSMGSVKIEIIEE